MKRDIDRKRRGKNYSRQWSHRPAPAVNSRSLIHVFNCSNLLLILNTAARIFPSCASIPSLRPSKGDRKVRTKKETWQPSIHNCYFGAAFLDLVCRCFRSMILVQFVWFGSLEVGGGRSCPFPMEGDYLSLRNFWRIVAIAYLCLHILVTIRRGNPFQIQFLLVR